MEKQKQRKGETERKMYGNREGEKSKGDLSGRKKKNLKHNSSHSAIKGKNAESMRFSAQGQSMEGLWVREQLMDCEDA